jgi:hypothetical protein
VSIRIEDGLPQLDPIALGIGDPAESTDTEVDHDLLVTGPEVVGLGFERREHRRRGFLTPQAVLIGVQA